MVNSTIKNVHSWKIEVSIKRHLMWYFHSIKYVDRWKFLTFVIKKKKKAFLVLSSKCFIKERSFGQLDCFLRLCSLFFIFPFTHFHQGLLFRTGKVQTGAEIKFDSNNIWGRVSQVSLRERVNDPKPFRSESASVKGWCADHVFHFQIGRSESFPKASHHCPQQQWRSDRWLGMFRCFTSTIRKALEETRTTASTQHLHTSSTFRFSPFGLQQKKKSRLEANAREL